MSTASELKMIDRITRTCQIIVVCLVAGVAGLSWDRGVDRSGYHAAQRNLPPASRPVRRKGPNKMPEANTGPDAGANANRDAGTVLDAFVSGPFLTYTAILFAAIALPLSFVLPGIVATQQRRAVAAGKWPVPPGPGMAPQAPATETGQLAVVYQTQLIIGAAMIEGAAFFAAAAYFIEKSLLAPGIGRRLAHGNRLAVPDPKTDRALDRPAARKAHAGETGWSLTPS